MKKTKIICTIGPASDSEQVIAKLIESGMNVARLNFSHGTHEEHKGKIDLIKKVRESYDDSVAIMLDTKGPEVRIRQFLNGTICLSTDDEFIFTTRRLLGDEKRVSVTYEKLPQELEVGDYILADDGLLKFRVKEIKGDEVICNVENGGELKNNKSLNFPNTSIRLPAITKKDEDDILFGIREGIDIIAASFIRKRQDVLEIRKILEKNKGDHIQIISKIENREGVDHIDSILEVSDGIMVARGDLGVEISPEEVPLVQKEIIKKCNQLGKPVITATQMLDSMIRNPRPTRAEVTDVANAVLDGSDATMLSGETAIGKYPIESVETMVRIAKKMEDSTEYQRLMSHVFNGEHTVTNVVSHATCTTADQLEAAAIMAVTSSGYTARMIAKFRPTSPIIAITDTMKVVRALSLVWGVQCVKANVFTNTDSIINESILTAVKRGLVELGDLVVICSGIPMGVKGATNMMKIQAIGNVLLKGVGIGNKVVTAMARIVEDSANINFNEGDILVTYGVDKDNIEYVKKASGIITEESGLTSQGAIAALQFGIPIVVGVENALTEIQEGSIITIEPLSGVIYNAKG